ncbi:MAG: hypothetical protein IPF45_05740 [Thermomonas sp.]|nr:hypothetical protein [Thermomonas sp.]
MKRALVSVLVLASLAPIAAMAQDGPSFSLFAGRDMSVNGDVHGRDRADRRPRPAQSGAGRRLGGIAHRVAVLR